MSDLKPDTTNQIRPATLRDAVLLAQLADLAGEGLPAYLWSQLTVGDQTPLEVGIQRAVRDDGSFSWRNAQVAWLGGKAVGTVIDYDLDAAELPGSEVPEYLHPLCALELSAVGSRYINILAVLPEMRRQGVARALIEHVAARTDRDLTLIVRSGNAPALAFYESEGFDQEKAIPVGRGGPRHLTGRWCLMRRPSGSRVISEHQNTVDRRRIPA